MASNNNEYSQWFLIYTKAKEEMRAKKNLENQGFEIFLPIIVYEEIDQHKSTSLETMFPRYLFIRFNPEKDNWSHIRSTKGVSHLVLFGQEFAKVPNEVIVLLKQIVDDNDIFRQKITRQQFKEGDKLVIKEGILEGKEAIFISNKGKDRVQVLLRLVNQSVNTEIPASYVGQKEIRKAFKF